MSESPAPSSPCPPPADPSHVAIIMDGNGRWAQRQGLPRNDGHREGVENVKRIVRAARDLNLRYLTLYAFSVENWRRPRVEVDLLMMLLEDFLREQMEELTQKEVRLRVLGRWEELPRNIRRLLKEAIDATAHYDRWTLSLALNYGSRTEFLDAMKRYAHDVREGRRNPEDLDWDSASDYLYTRGLPDPDLIIRTSGETRVSNFLLLQGAYAEYYFSPKYWPEFREEDLREALACYRARERRFGKTGEQVRSVSHASS